MITDAPDQISQPAPCDGRVEIDELAKREKCTSSETETRDGAARERRQTGAREETQRARAVLVTHEVTLGKETYLTN
eukprot:6987929-Pyramimonas_sp.AAC.1